MGQFLTEREKAIILIDNDCLTQSDAIVLLEGDGYFRYRKAVSLYKQGWADKIIFSGGITDYNYGSYPYSDILPLMINEGIEKKNIIHEDKSHNTHEQALEVIKLANIKKWKKLILVASHNHQYRAYLTFLRVIIDNNLGMILYNSPVSNLNWFQDNPWGKRYDKLDAEFERITHYSELGHLATYKEVIEYQKWKEEQL